MDTSYYIGILEHFDKYHLNKHSIELDLSPYTKLHIHHTPVAVLKNYSKNNIYLQKKSKNMYKN